MKRSKTKKPFVVDVVTLFPSMFNGPFSESLMGRAQQAGLVEIKIHNLRDWSDEPRHAKVDDRPYGGGAGMVIRAEPVYRAIKSIVGNRQKKDCRVVYLSPQGQTLNQKTAQRLSELSRLVLICGHYEGLDERAMDFIDEEVSIGEYVLTGGELPAMVLMDAVIRLKPGVVGDPASLIEESFSKGLLDYPHYTRPRLWRGKKVPDVLLSGNHADIRRWRQKMAEQQTAAKRPDMLKTLKQK